MIKTHASLPACLLISLIAHAAVISAGHFHFPTASEQKPFEVEFETAEELLPKRYELEKEKKVEALVPEETPAPAEAPDEKLKQSFLRYQDSIKQKIQEEKTYPRAALRIGYQGTARIAFRVLSSGHVEDLRLVRSSNFKQLDQESLDAVKRASPFRAFPEEFEGSEIEIEVDIIFRIANK